MSIMYSEDNFKTSMIMDSGKSDNKERRQYIRTRIPLGFCSADDDIHEFAKAVEENFVLLERLKEEEDGKEK